MNTMNTALLSDNVALHDSAQLCYRHVLKNAPELKAKLGDDLHAFRPSRWLGPEVSKSQEWRSAGLPRWNCKVDFEIMQYAMVCLGNLLVIGFKMRNPETFKTPSCSCEDVSTLTVTWISAGPGHCEVSTIRFLAVWSWCSCLLGEATGRLRGALGDCTGRFLEDGWMSEWAGGWVGGLIERSIDGQTDRRIDGYIYIYIYRWIRLD